MQANVDLASHLILAYFVPGNTTLALVLVWLHDKSLFAPLSDLIPKVKPYIWIALLAWILLALLVGALVHALARLLVASFEKSEVLLWLKSEQETFYVQWDHWIPWPFKLLLYWIIQPLLRLVTPKIPNRLTHYLQSLFGKRWQGVRSLLIGRFQVPKTEIRETLLNKLATRDYTLAYHLSFALFYKSVTKELYAEHSRIFAIIDLLRELLLLAPFATYLLALKLDSCWWVASFLSWVLLDLALQHTRNTYLHWWYVIPLRYVLAADLHTNN